MVGPVAADGARTKPLPVHGAQCFIGVATLAECDKSIATRSTSLHVPHDTSFGDRTESAKGLEQDLIVDLVGQIANKNMEVVRSVLLGDGIGLISPVDANFLNLSVPASSRLCLFAYRLMNAPAIEGRHCTLGGSGIVVLHESIVGAFRLELLVSVRGNHYRHRDFWAGAEFI